MVAVPLTPSDGIEKRVRASRPLNGGPIPGDLSARLGATHYDGKYHLTDEPFLLEGCRALRKLGMGLAKLWFAPRLPGYGYNSQWDLPPKATLVDIAKHPYFVEAFAFPFSTFALEISHKVGPQPDFGGDETQFRDLTRHLRETYRDRDVTFILQHWEGDWMLRAGAGKKWQPGGPPDVKEQGDRFARWLAARQRGVNAGRADVPDSKCRVFHAAEVNTVLDTLKGIPTLCSHVLPQVELDLVSWSSYDGMRSATHTWHGLEIIQHFARFTDAHPEPRLFIGEVGLPESGRTKEQIVEFWDRAMGVFFAWDLPYVIHWELYCNEPKDGNKQSQRLCTAEELRGFWLIRPDGSQSHAAEYLTMLLAHAGGALPANQHTRR